jgi:hypothetical protein
MHFINFFKSFKVRFISLPQIAGPRSVPSSNLLHGGLPQGGLFYSSTPLLHRPVLISVSCFADYLMHCHYMVDFVLMLLVSHLSFSSYCYSSTEKMWKVVSSLHLVPLCVLSCPCYTLCNFGYLLCSVAWLWVNVTRGTFFVHSCNALCDLLHDLGFIVYTMCFWPFFLHVRSSVGDIADSFMYTGNYSFWIMF